MRITHHGVVTLSALGSIIDVLHDKVRAMMLYRVGRPKIICQIRYMSSLLWMTTGSNYSQINVHSSRKRSTWVTSFQKMACGQIESFIGIISYYRKFILEFAYVCGARTRLRVLAHSSKLSGCS